MNDWYRWHRVIRVVTSFAIGFLATFGIIFYCGGVMALSGPIDWIGFLQFSLIISPIMGLMAVVARN